MPLTTDRARSDTLEPLHVHPLAVEPSEQVIRPAGAWNWPNLGELWRYRELLFFLCWRDVKVRYKQTILGLLWAVLQPAALMCAFAFVLSKYAAMSAGGIPYPLFVLTGLVPWVFFATALTSASNSVLSSERLITKVYFPRLAVPFAAVGAAVLDFLVACVLLAAVVLWYGFPVGPGLLLAPIFFAAILLAALGVGTFLAAAVVAYRDFKYVVPFIVQVGLFATPTVYTAVGTGPEAPLALWLNPLAPLIQGFRASILGGPVPWAAAGLAAVVIAVTFLVGCLYFRQVEDRFADII